ncbi:MAG TPA: hypothetical protein P5313_14335 [Spirochaetia bacterium]|nr:hypothetical protein [Spirochaetales bacterium]HRY81591.1 hypothetical protein [Spirochaetia bacterium]
MRTQPRPAPAARIRTILAFALAAALPVIGQPTPSAPGPAPASPASAPSSGLPRGFRGVELGMSLSEVETVLKADELFLYRGGPDVTLLPRPDEKLLEVQGLSYVKRAFFQFHEDKLFSAIYVLNPERVDHYSVFTRLSDRYGKPGSLSPRESVWSDGSVRLSLERPLTVKYLDLGTLEKFMQGGQARQSWEDLSRQDFLESF